MASTEPQPKLTERTIVVVTELMQRDGLDASDSDAFAAYLERIVSRERLFRTVDEARSAFADLDSAELNAMIDEEVDVVEDDFRKRSLDANPA